MWIAVAAIVVFCLFPFYWLVNISLKTGADLSVVSLIPPNPTLDNYKSIFQNDDFTRALGNSAIVALVTTVLALVVGSFCAYALARLKLQGQVLHPRASSCRSRRSRRSRSRRRCSGCGRTSASSTR